MDEVQRAIRASAIDLVTKYINTGDRTRLDGRIDALRGNIDRIGDREDTRAQATVAENKFELAAIERELAFIEEWGAQSQAPAGAAPADDGGE